MRRGIAIGLLARSVELEREGAETPELVSEREEEE